MTKNNVNQLKTRMSKRLKALHKAIPVTTEHFWDLCCDHGALGRSVLETNPHCTVLFNDIHTSITQILSDKLVELNAVKFSINTGPAEQLIINNPKNLTVMLAGIGDELCISILSELFKQLNSINVRFIISPANKVQNVRKFLVEQQVSLQRESLVTENNQTYEIIEIDFPANGQGRIMTENDDIFGRFWEAGDLEHIRHLKKLIRFYQAQATNRQIETAIESAKGYQFILDEISK